MAFSGAHIACGYTNSLPGSGLLSNAVWSQTMAAGGVTAQAAPPSNATGIALGGSVVQAFEFRATADSYVAVGAVPDAAAGTRIFVPANLSRSFYCLPGDKLAWAAA